MGRGSRDSGSLIVGSRDLGAAIACLQYFRLARRPLGGERPGTPPCAQGNWTEGVRLRRDAFRYRPCPNLPRPTTFCGPQPTETRTHHAEKCSSILVSHPRDHKCSVVNPSMPGQLHSGASIRVVPCNPFHGELLRLLLIGLRTRAACECTPLTALRRTAGQRPRMVL